MSSGPVCLKATTIASGRSRGSSSRPRTREGVTRISIRGSDFNACSALPPSIPTSRTRGIGPSESLGFPLRFTWSLAPAAERVRPKLQAPQDFATCFELGGNGIPDSVAVHRLSNLSDVEFWSISGCERQRTQLSDMFSASLVLGPCEVECGRVWSRGKEQTFRSGDILLAETDEVQRI